LRISLLHLVTSYLLLKWQGFLAARARARLVIPARATPYPIAGDLPEETVTAVPTTPGTGSLNRDPRRYLHE